MELVTSRKCDEDIALICVFFSFSLCTSGSTERENEWRAQQAFIRHRRSAANRVQRTPAASSERAHGCPGRQGKACAHSHLNCSCSLFLTHEPKRTLTHKSPSWLFLLFCLERPHSGSRKLPKTAWGVPPHQGVWSFIKLILLLMSQNNQWNKSTLM